MQRFCLTLQLKPSPTLIEQYIAYHRAVWPEVLESLRACGIEEMEIYLLDTTLTMIMDTDDTFTLERKAAMDAANPTVQKWERTMEQFQDAPAARPKWKKHERVFSLSASLQAIGG